MSIITEDTALRLTAALERVATALEGGNGEQLLGQGHQPSGRDYVARSILGGWEAAKAENARNRKTQRRSR